MHLTLLIGLDGADIRLHDSVPYNSLYLGDETMIVNAHRYGINAYATPVLHLRRAAGGGLFDGYLDSFEDVWQVSRAAPKE